jgi:REP-associated tyrosine transposase
MRYRRVFLPGASYFFTLIVHQRAPLFSDAFTIDLFTHTVRKVQTERPFTLEAQVILPDHVHVLWTLPEGDTDYPTRVRLIKAAFTRLILRSRPPAKRSHSRIAKGEQAVWQRRYWEHTIRDERDFQAHLDYIHINPVKHGLVSAARDWPHSTFRDWVARGAYDESWGSGEMPALPESIGRE